MIDAALYVSSLALGAILGWCACSCRWRRWVTQVTHQVEQATQDVEEML